MRKSESFNVDEGIRERYVAQRGAEGESARSNAQDPFGDAVVRRGKGAGIAEQALRALFKQHAVNDGKGAVRRYGDSRQAVASFKWVSADETTESGIVIEFRE